MKKILAIMLGFVLPGIAAAAPLTGDYVDATDTNATSTFAGNVSVSGKTSFSLGTGLLSLVSGIVSTSSVEGPLSFSDNTLRFTVPGTTTQIIFNENGVLAGSSKFTWSSEHEHLFVENIAAGLPTYVSGEQGFGPAIVNMTRGSVSSPGTWESGGITINGGGLLVDDETNYDSLNTGMVHLEAGEIGAGVDSTGDAILQLYGGSWTSSGGWQGGDVVIRSGRVPSSVPSRVGKISLAAHPLDTAATTTIEFGIIGDSNSRTCFNTKNTTGSDISFYFVGTTMVVESNTCR